MRAGETLAIPWARGEASADPAARGGGGGPARIPRTRRGRLDPLASPGGEGSSRPAPRPSGMEEMRGAPRARGPNRTFEALSPRKYPRQKPEISLLLSASLSTVPAAGESAQTSRSPAEVSAALRGSYPAGGAGSRGGLAAAAAARGRGGFLGATTPRRRPGEPRACGAAASGEEKRK